MFTSFERVVHFKIGINLEILIERSESIHDAGHFSAVRTCHQLAIYDCCHSTISVYIEACIACQRSVTTHNTKIVFIQIQSGSVLYRNEVANCLICIICMLTKSNVRLRYCSSNTATSPSSLRQRNAPRLP